MYAQMGNLRKGRLQEYSITPSSWLAIPGEAIPTEAISVSGMPALTHTERHSAAISSAIASEERSAPVGTLS